MSDLRRLPAPLTGVWQWQQYGSCRGQGTALFFHPEGERGLRRDNREAAAKALCAPCPVQLACRAHALAVGERFGVWGGLSVSGRDLLAANGSESAPGRPASVATGLSRERTSPSFGAT